jgi:glutamine amidotransferase
LTVILDYGMGNLRSVEKAVQFLGVQCVVQGDLGDATKLIIPGVGAFGAAMERLAPLKSEIVNAAKSGLPILGICLGQQLLFESSEEMGTFAGLGLIEGSVKYLPKDQGLKVPQMGWNDARFQPSSRLGQGVPADGQVYFVHSLYTECANSADIAATTEYGISFASAVERENILGTQFHPEKSGDVGMQILRNFLEWS